MARVPLMPTSQSDSERQMAASASGSIGGVGAQGGKALANGGRGHGLEPEALDGLFGLGVLDDVTENQFAFAAGVASVDQAVHVLALDEAEQDLEARAGFLDGLEIEVRRNDGQVGKSPFAAFDFHPFGQAQLEQMPDGGREHKLVALEVIVLLDESAEGLGDVRGHRGLFRDNQCFSHECCAKVAQRPA